MAEDSPIEPAVLIAGLAKRMTEKKLDWRYSKEWTVALKDCLRDLFEENGNTGLKVDYSDPQGNRHEFMLDVVVWGSPAGERLVLAVESEWSQNIKDVAEDFRKLLVVKAPLKLMIFACEKNPRKFSQEKLWEELCKCLGKYRGPSAGEKYIFMNYALAPGRKAWWIEIPRTGKFEADQKRNFVDFE